MASKSEKKIKYGNEEETLIQFGPNIRMDRNVVPQPDGSYLWNVYALEKVIDKKHPHTGRETTEESVWMPKGQGNEQSARELCSVLSGITKEN